MIPDSTPFSFPIFRPRRPRPTVDRRRRIRKRRVRQLINILGILQAPVRERHVACPVQLVAHRKSGCQPPGKIRADFRPRRRGQKHRPVANAKCRQRIARLGIPRLLIVGRGLWQRPNIVFGSQAKRARVCSPAISRGGTRAPRAVIIPLLRVVHLVVQVLRRAVPHLHQPAQSRLRLGGEVRRVRRCRSLAPA